MEDTDFYRIYRKSEEDELYFDEPFTKWQAWTDLISLHSQHQHTGEERMRVQEPAGVGYTLEVEQGKGYQVHTLPAMRRKGDGRQVKCGQLH